LPIVRKEQKKFFLVSKMSRKTQSSSDELLENCSETYWDDHSTLLRSLFQPATCTQFASLARNLIPKSIQPNLNIPFLVILIEAAKRNCKDFFKSLSAYITPPMLAAWKFRVVQAVFESGDTEFAQWFVKNFDIYKTAEVYLFTLCDGTRTTDRPDDWAKIANMRPLFPHTEKYGGVKFFNTGGYDLLDLYEPPLGYFETASFSLDELNYQRFLTKRDLYRFMTITALQGKLEISMWIWNEMGREAREAALSAGLLSLLQLSARCRKVEKKTMAWIVSLQKLEKEFQAKRKT
jgi:hypothetical protein